MKPIERRTWVLEYLKALQVRAYYPPSVNVLDADFVNKYVLATGARVGLMPYGAHKCPQLGRDLSTLFRVGSLTRERVGLDGMGGMGFPTWVWVYQLPQPKKLN